LIPIVALLLSTAFEDYRWQPASIIGVSLCLLGNVLVISRRS
jgi:drug/metabolite transporter (DMT)-like permease